MNSFPSSLLVYVALGLSIGFSLASQSGVNSQLRIALASPVHAAFISFLIGTLILGVLTVRMGKPFFVTSEIRNIPWWAWLGGVFGALNITVSVFLAPKIGALSLAVLVVSGQVIASMIYDQNGWLGYPKIEWNNYRLLGSIFVIAGVMLIIKR